MDLRKGFGMFRFNVVLVLAAAGLGGALAMNVSEPEWPEIATGQETGAIQRPGRLGTGDPVAGREPVATAMSARVATSKARTVAQGERLAWDEARALDQLVRGQQMCAATAGTDPAVADEVRGLANGGRLAFHTYRDADRLDEEFVVWVCDAAGGVVQTIGPVELTGNIVPSPYLADLNEDGLQDLVFGVAQGLVNTGLEIWFQGDDRAFFFAGNLSGDGIDVYKQHEFIFVRTEARANCCIYISTVMQVTPSGLTDYYTLERDISSGTCHFSRLSETAALREDHRGLLERCDLAMAAMLDTDAARDLSLEQ